MDVVAEILPEETLKHETDVSGLAQNEVIPMESETQRDELSQKKEKSPRKQAPKTAKLAPKKPRSSPRKKATPPPKLSPKKQTTTTEAEKDVTLTKRTRTKSQTNWSDLIYGGEKYNEGDTLAVRAPKESGELFWLCTLDGVGTEENPEDLEITWYESKGNNVYVEGEEDDISAETVICKTRLNIGAQGTWLLPPVELKSIRDNLKLEKEDSSEEERKEFSRDEESEKSLKEEDDQLRDGNTERKVTRAKRESRAQGEKRDAKGQGEKRDITAANLDPNGSPRPKRRYKKREKKTASTEITQLSTQTTTTTPTEETASITTLASTAISISTGIFTDQPVTAMTTNI